MKKLQKGHRGQDFLEVSTLFWLDKMLVHEIKVGDVSAQSNRVSDMK